MKFLDGAAMSLSTLADLCAKQKAAARDADKRLRDRASNAVGVLDIEKERLSEAFLVGLLVRNQSALENPEEHAALVEIGKRKISELLNAYDKAHAGASASTTKASGCVRSEARDSGNGPAQQDDVPVPCDVAAPNTGVPTSSSLAGDTSMSGVSSSDSRQIADEMLPPPRSMPPLVSGSDGPSRSTETEEALHPSSKASLTISNATAVPNDALSVLGTDSHVVSSVEVLDGRSATPTHREGGGDTANSGATSGSVSPSYTSMAAQKATSSAPPIASPKAATVAVRQASPIVTDRDGARSVSASQSRDPTAPAPS